MGAESTAVLGFPLAYAATQRFTLGVPRSISVVDNGRLVVFLRSVDGRAPALSMWKLDTATGEERRLVDPSELGTDDHDLTPEEAARRERVRESAGGVVSYSTARSTALATFVLGGSIHLVDLHDGAVRTVASATPAFDARLSPSGHAIAYTAGSDVRVVILATDTAGDVDRAVSPPESEPTITWGQAEFVAAEEMGRVAGFWWSPTGDALLAARVDVGAVNEWHIADPARPERPAASIRYPAAGTANAAVTLHLLPLDGTGVREILWNDGSLEYLADVAWSNDGLVVVGQTRDQRTTSIVTIDIETGEREVLRSIGDQRWTELHPGAPRLHEGSLLTIEDLPDRRALCVDGAPVTAEGLQVRSIIDAHDGVAVITASTDPTEIQVLRIGVDGTTVEQLTDTSGVHSAWASGGTIVVAASTAETPFTEFEVRSHHGRSRLANHCEDPVMRSEPSFRMVGARGLATAIFLPLGHDGATKLPVLLDPYGGPHAQRVLKNHNPHLVSRWFAEQGYAVIVTDGRGTPGRGPAFEREVWGDLAGPVLEDQIDALDAAADELGCLDLGRVGIRGWSFGGYLAALAVLRVPDRVHAAVAGAPVTDWSLYDTHYTERYLGHPDENPEHYERTSLLGDAAKLTRPLLLIHGLADDNVVAAHTLRLSSALLAQGRTHQVLPLSGVTHMTPQAVVAKNLLVLQRDFLDQHLGPDHDGTCHP